MEAIRKGHTRFFEYGKKGTVNPESNIQQKFPSGMKEKSVYSQMKEN